MLSSDIKRKRVEEIMSATKHVIGPHDQLSEALGMMKKHGISEIAVVDGRRFLGYLTFRTLARRRKLPITAQVKSFMVTPPKVKPTDKIPMIAEKLITRDFSTLPITQNNAILGTISRRDIIRALLDDPYMSSTPVEAIMNFAPKTLREDTDILQALASMELNGDTCSAVLDKNGHMTGCVTVSDIVTFMQMPMKRPKKGDLKGEKVHQERLLSSVATVPETLDRTSTIREAAELLLKLNTSNVFVTDGKELAGVVSEVDIIELLLRGPHAGGPLIQIAGIEDAKLMDAQDIHLTIQKYLGKIEKFTPISSVTVRIKHHHYETDENKYTVNVKLTTPTNFIAREGNDWELESAMGNAFMSVEKQVRKDHDKKSHR
ncbi:MAG: CBS domain-containing protein [Thermoplasmatota archaeon]